MALREIEFSSAKLFDVRHRLRMQSFAAVDPGLDGACLAFRVGQVPVSKVWPMSVGDAYVAGQLREMGVRLIFVEAQHAKMNSRTALALARTAMRLPAMLAGAWLEAGQDVDLVWVHPATWQAMLRKPGARLQAGEAKKRAWEKAEQIMGSDGRWVGATKKQRQGIADALCIGLWAGRLLA